MTQYFKKSKNFLALLLAFLVAFTMMPVQSFAAVAKTVTWGGTVVVNSAGTGLTSTLKATLTGGETFAVKGKNLTKTTDFIIGNPIAGITPVIKTSADGKSATVSFTVTSAAKRVDSKSLDITFTAKAFKGGKTITGFKKSDIPITFVTVKSVVAAPTSVVAGVKTVVTVTGLNLPTTTRVDIYKGTTKLDATKVTVAKLSGATSKVVKFNVTPKNTSVAGTYTAKVYVGSALKKQANFTVTAATKYKVTYNKNNAAATGTVPADATGYLKGTQATVKAVGTLALKDNAFQGWATNAAGTGTIYKAGTKVTVNANMTLYAVWKNSTVAVTGVTVTPTTTEFLASDATTVRKEISATVAPTTATDKKVKWTITGTDAANFELYDAETAGNVVALDTDTSVVKVYVAPKAALTAATTATVTATSVADATKKDASVISVAASTNGVSTVAITDAETVAVTLSAAATAVDFNSFAVLVGTTELTGVTGTTPAAGQFTVSGSGTAYVITLGTAMADGQVISVAGKAPLVTTAKTATYTAPVPTKVTIDSAVASDSKTIVVKSTLAGLTFRFGMGTTDTNILASNIDAISAYTQGKYTITLKTAMLSGAKYTLIAEKTNLTSASAAITYKTVSVPVSAQVKAVTNVNAADEINALNASAVKVTVGFAANVYETGTVSVTLTDKNDLEATATADIDGDNNVIVTVNASALADGAVAIKTTFSDGSNVSTEFTGTPIAKSAGSSDVTEITSSRVSATEGTFSLKSSKAGRLYYVVRETADAAPSAATIKASTTTSDITSANTTVTVSLKTLVTGKTYKVYYVIVDNNNNESTPAFVSVSSETATSLTKAANLRLKNNALYDGVYTWTEVPNAVGYKVVVKKDSSEIVLPTEVPSTVTTNEVNVSKALVDAGRYVIQIIALGDGTTYKDAPISDPSNEVVVSSKPSYTIDYSTEKSEIVSGSTQYNFTSATAAASEWITAGAKVDYTPGSVAKKIYIRTAASLTAPASAVQELSVKARPVSPAATSAVVTKNATKDNAVNVTATIAGLEAAISMTTSQPAADAKWDALTKDTAVLLTDAAKLGYTVWVRKSAVLTAGSEAFASESVLVKTISSSDISSSIEVKNLAELKAALSNPSISDIRLTDSATLDANLTIAAGKTVTVATGKTITMGAFDLTLNGNLVYVSTGALPSMLASLTGKVIVGPTGSIADGDGTYIGANGTLNVTDGTVSLERMADSASNMGGAGAHIKMTMNGNVELPATHKWSIGAAERIEIKADKTLTIKGTLANTYNTASIRTGMGFYGDGNVAVVGAGTISALPDLFRNKGGVKLIGSGVTLGSETRKLIGPASSVTDVVLSADGEALLTGVLFPALDSNAGDVDDTDLTLTKGTATIQIGRALQPNGLLTVKKDTTLEIAKSAKLNLAATGNIKIEEGGKVNVQGGGKLEVVAGWAGTKLENAGTLTVNGDMDIAATCKLVNTGTIAIMAGSILQVDGTGTGAEFTNSGAGTFTNDGTLKLAGATTVTQSSTGAISLGNVTEGHALTVAGAGNGNITVGTVANNVTISNTGTGTHTVGKVTGVATISGATTGTTTVAGAATLNVTANVNTLNVTGNVGTALSVSELATVGTLNIGKATVTLLNVGIDGADGTSAITALKSTDAAAKITTMVVGAESGDFGTVGIPSQATKLVIESLTIANNNSNVVTVTNPIANVANLEIGKTLLTVGGATGGKLIGNSTNKGAFTLMAVQGDDTTTVGAAGTLGNEASATTAADLTIKVGSALTNNQFALIEVVEHSKVGITLTSPATLAAAATGSGADAGNGFTMAAAANNATTIFGTAGSSAHSIVCTYTSANTTYTVTIEESTVS